MRGRKQQILEHTAERVASVGFDSFSYGEMTLAGKPAHHAMLLISAIKGALQFSRSHGIEVVANTIKQLKFTLGLKPE